MVQDRDTPRTESGHGGPQGKQRTPEFKGDLRTDASFYPQRYPRYKHATPSTVTRTFPNSGAAGGGGAVSLLLCLIQAIVYM